MTLNAELLRRFVGNWLKTRLLKGMPVRPLILSYFVTFRCNLKCAYCDYWAPLYQERYPELPTADAIRVLEICREGNPALALSGGEPLLREDIVDIVKAARRLDYWPISLFTNSLLLPERENVLDYVDFLQISLDTVNESSQGKTADHRGLAAKVKENVRAYARMQKKKKFKINVNCVVSEDHIDDARAVLDFARSHGVRFTIAPRLINERPAPALVGNPQYAAVIEGLIRDKHRSRTIMDTTAYLSHIRFFQPFSCLPWLTPRVYPNGKLLYPCPILSYSVYDVLEIGSWKELERKILTAYDAHVVCARQCFLPCYLETSTLISDFAGGLKDLSRL
jgi:MoaA/NifB/PqqE/SkfB family radical SAM enzyme